MQAKEVVDQVAMRRALTRITYKITERNHSIQDIVLIGTRTWGIYIASRIAERLRQLEDIGIPAGELDITLYRGDEKGNLKEPELHSPDTLASLEGKEVILIDGVLYTGRTIRTTVDAVMDLGRPRKISLAALIGREHRELSIRADYVGRDIPTSRAREILIEVQELDGQDRIMISKGED